MLHKRQLFWLVPDHDETDKTRGRIDLALNSTELITGMLNINVVSGWHDDNCTGEKKNKNKKINKNKAKHPVKKSDY